MIKLKRISLKEAAEATWEQVSRFYYYVKDEAALDYFTTHDNPEYAKKYKDELHLRWNPGTKKYEFSQWSTFYPMYFHAGYDKALEEVFPNRAWLSMFDSDTGKIKKEQILNVLKQDSSGNMIVNDLIAKTNNMSDDEIDYKQFLQIMGYNSSPHK